MIHCLNRFSANNLNTSPKELLVYHLMSNCLACHLNPSVYYHNLICLFISVIASRNSTFSFSHRRPSPYATVTHSLHLPPTDTYHSRMDRQQSVSQLSHPICIFFRSIPCVCLFPYLNFSFSPPSIGHLIFPSLVLSQQKLISCCF